MKIILTSSIEFWVDRIHVTPFLLSRIWWKITPFGCFYVRAITFFTIPILFYVPRVIFQNKILAVECTEAPVLPNVLLLCSVILGVPTPAPLYLQTQGHIFWKEYLVWPKYTIPNKIHHPKHQNTPSKTPKRHCPKHKKHRPNTKCHLEFKIPNKAAQMQHKHSLTFITWVLLSQDKVYH